MGALMTLLWFTSTSLLLGPLALWFVLSAKKNRRHLETSFFSHGLLLSALFVLMEAFLFLAPVHWGILLGLYLISSLFTAAAMNRPERASFFKIDFLSQTSQKKGTFLGYFLPQKQAWQSAALALFPLIYILALLHNFVELQNFSIHLPSDVYTDGLLWMLYGTPLILFAAILIERVGITPSLRTLIYFYGAVLIVLLWIMMWEKLDQILLNSIYGLDRDPLFFSLPIEVKYRLVVKSLFYGLAFFLGAGYLVKAARTGVFIKRALFLGLPSLLLYANLLFVLGDWNFYLSGLRTRTFIESNYQAYRYFAKAQWSRTPAAYRFPQSLEDWSELEYQTGNLEKSQALLKELVKLTRSKPYYSRIRKRAERSLAMLAKYQASPSTDSNSRAIVKPNEFPSIKPASYLDQDWYALLSAVGFLKPDWSDLDLKKKLLDLSSSIQLHLPKLDNIPELIPVIRQLEIPASTCFLTLDRIKTALSEGHVPFMSLFGHWVPISGYDPGRDGFYYYSHQKSTGWDWFQNEETDLFDHTEKTEAHGSYSQLKKFIPADDLAQHIVDIGGVGLILGDNASIPKPEKEAAFMVEQGDVYYQEHDNYEAAAELYKKASQLFPDDQVFSRMVYLKRRYSEIASDPGDYQNLFRDYPPDWVTNLGPDSIREKEITAKVLEGKLGTYLMMNWYVTPPPDSSSLSKRAMDTAMSLFTFLHERDPEEPLYTDSLATFLQRHGNLVGSEKLFSDLMGLYPFGNESAAFRLAWVKFKLGKIKEVPALLDLADSFSGEAKYLTLRAAVAMAKGHYRSAFTALSKSLKLDKTVGETHVLMEDYYLYKGDKAAAQVHHQWQKRST